MADLDAELADTESDFFSMLADSYSRSAKTAKVNTAMCESRHRRGVTALCT